VLFAMGGCGCKQQQSVSDPVKEKEGTQKGDDKTLLPTPANEEPKQQFSSVQVYGVTFSMNCMGTIMVVTQERLGTVVPTMPSQTVGEGTLSPDFLKINPFHSVPAIKDGDLCVGESNSVLRYLSGKYVGKLYLSLGKQRRAHVDWAMDTFTSTLYADVLTCLYPVLGFHPKLDGDQAEVGKKATEGLQKFADVFLQEKFIGGKEISIADYKVAPFFFLYAHPKVKEISKVEIPERIKQFNFDFKAACPVGAQVLVEGEHSVKGYLDKQTGNEEPMIESKQGFKEASLMENVWDWLSNLTTGGKGDVIIHGVTVSMNCMGPILLQNHCGMGKMEVCLPTDSQSTEYRANFPYGGMPGLQDGKWCMSESCAILRYMAREYAEDLYPTDPAKRAHIDWALDRLTFGMRDDADATIHVAMGFASPPENQVAAAEKASKGLKEFCDFFLTDKFVGGSVLSIADFKVAPFFCAYAHPRVSEKCKVEIPERVLQFNKDFRDACPSAPMMYAGSDQLPGGGMAIWEVLDSRDTAEKGEASPVTQEAAQKVVDHDPTIDNTTSGCGCSVFG